MKILFFSGSLRRGSMNCQIAELASEVAAQESGISPIFLSLKDFDIPLYDGDIEERFGMPEGVEQLKQLFLNSKALYIASPEYNSSFSGALKNAIDWVSRVNTKNEPMLSAFRNKHAAITAASAGKFGGINGMNALRLVLSNIGVNVIPNQVAIPAAQNVLDKNGKIKDEFVEKAIREQVKQLCNIVRQTSESA